ncbi:MAG TPA: hypothetical protein PK537_05390 [Candidatus Limiplasma sp.]|nr:hypothetical protein [Candidatus Limiplasma sp.]
MYRRIVTLLCVLALLTAGCTLTAAAQTQQTITVRGYDAELGYEYIEMGVYPYYSNGAFAPILWRVLAVDEEYAVLRSEYALFPVRGTQYSSVYDLVNEDRLYQKYVLVNQAVVASAEISLNDLQNADYGDTASADALRIVPTPYAASKGALMDDVYAAYWTYLGKKAYYVTPDGDVAEISYTMTLGTVPIVTVNLEALQLDSGYGTLSDPYYSSTNVLDLFMEQKMAINPKFAADIDYGKLIPGPELYADSESYYALGVLDNPEHKQVLVYTGPGTDYYQPDGVALRKDKVALKILGFFGDWVWVEYKADAHWSDDVYRTGYIRAVYMGDYIDTWEKYFAFPEYSFPAVVKADTPLYDDRYGVQDGLETLQAGTKVTFLGYMDQGDMRLAYIETTISGQPARGFVAFDLLSIDDTGMISLLEVE